MKMHKFSVILILVVIILAVIFYWFEWRPNKIRTKCNDSAFNGFMASSDPKAFTQEERMKLNEQFYKDCLRSEGLKE